MELPTADSCFWYRRGETMGNVIDVNNICVNCMHTMDETTRYCPSCGYERGTYVNNPSASGFYDPAGKISDWKMPWRRWFWYYISCPRSYLRPACCNQRTFCTGTAEQTEGKNRSDRKQPGIHEILPYL